MPKRPTRAFYQRNPVTVARALIGQLLVTRSNGKRTAGIIVETEAYLGTIDQAAHTANGRRTSRNESMWGPGGHAYVYFTYGMHYCMNVVASGRDDPVAVLIRALEPVEGLGLMSKRRQARRARGQPGRHTDMPQKQLCSGPARLCQALGIERSLDGTDLVNARSLFIEQKRHRAYSRSHIVDRPRIGVDYAGEWAAKPLRFYLKGNRHVSKP